MGTTSLNTLILRADADARIGAGHMMRCLALAQAWQADGGSTILAGHCESETLRRRIEAAGIEFVPIERPHPDPDDLSDTFALLNDRHADALALDGYHFDPIYQQAIRAGRHRLLVIDDNAHWPAYHADFVLNQNVDAHRLTYIGDPDTILLLGTRYALLRREFTERRERSRHIPDMARKVLVTLGGSDPDNATLKVIRALQQIEPDGLEAVVVIGATNPHDAVLRAAVQDRDHCIRLTHSPPDLADWMAWADITVSGGGSTCWETAFMGLPAIVLVLADNQAGLVSELERQGIVVSLGRADRVEPQSIAEAITTLTRDQQTRNEMSARGQRLIDGEGAARVAMRLRGDRVRLRRAREDDRRAIWEWANDPDVRAASFSTEPIAWERHVEWFAAKMSDPNCAFFIGIDEDDTPIGQVRFDINGPDAVIAIGLGAAFRAKGYGSALIETGSRRLFRTTSINVIHAHVKATNPGSIKAFAKAHYREAGTEVQGGQEAVHLIRRRDDT